MKKNIENKKPSFILLIILLGFPQLHEAMFSPSIQSIAHQYAIDVSKAQSVLSIYFLAFAMGVLFWGYFSDKYGRRLAMMLGFVTYVLGTAVVLFAPRFSVFMIGRFIAAIGLATGSVTTQTILREAFEPEIRNKLFSQVSVALAFVPGMGPMLGGALVDNGGIKALISVLLISGLVILGLIHTKLPETRTHETTSNVNLLEVAKRMIMSKNIWIYGFFIAAFNAVMSIYYMEIPLLFGEHFHMSLTTIGSFGIPMAFATVFGALCTQWLLKRHDPRNVILIGNGVMLLGSLFMMLVAIFMKGHPTQAYAYISAMVVIRFGTAIALSNAISLALNGFEDVYGTAGSLLSLGYYAGISGLMRMMTHLRTGSLVVMPLYFVTLSILLIALTLNVMKDAKNVT